MPEDETRTALSGWQTWFGAMLAQGMVASVWIVALGRVLRPVAPRVRARWARAALIWPVLLPSVQALLPSPWPGQWLAVAEVLRSLADRVGLLWWALGLLLGVITVLFVVQELLPALWAHRRWAGQTPQADLRLDRVAGPVQAAFAAAGMGAARQPVDVLVLPVDESVALLWGVLRPRVLVSRGLMAEVDDEMLAGVIAHELAHRFRGGNRSMMGLWLVRALQAASPAALMTFRNLVEIEELACDALAAQVLQRPAALASALLKTRRPHRAGARGLALVRQRGEIAFVRHRVRRLLDEPARPATGAWAGYGVGLSLGLILWGIG